MQRKRKQKQKSLSQRVVAVDHEDLVASLGSDQLEALRTEFKAYESGDGFIRAGDVGKVREEEGLLCGGQRRPCFSGFPGFPHVEPTHVHTCAPPGQPFREPTHGSQVLLAMGDHPKPEELPALVRLVDADSE
jgi:hypothetical protein